MKLLILVFFFLLVIIFSPFQKKPLVLQESFQSLPPGEQFEIVKEMAKSQGLENTWSFIKSAFAGEPDLNAHNLAHYFGLLLQERKGISGFGICDASFAFGCYHGFTEGYFKDGLDRLDEVEEACGKVGEVDSGPWASCIHGIGHGVATFHGTRDFSSALSSCDELSYGQTFCYDGVFMEFALNAPNSAYKMDDPLYPCNSVAAQYRSGCARNQTYVMRSRFGMSDGEIVQACIESGDPDIEFHCINSMGLTVGQQSGGKAEVILARCGEFPKPAQAGCFAGAAGEIIFQNYPGWQEEAPKVCNALAGENRLSCEQRVEDVIESYQR